MHGITTLKLTPVGRRIMEALGCWRDVNMTALARAAGVRHQTLRRMMTEGARVSARDLFLVADALKVPPRWLFDGTHEQNAAPDRPTPAAEPAPSVRTDAPADGPVPLYDGLAASRWDWCPWQPKFAPPYRSKSKEGAR